MNLSSTTPMTPWAFHRGVRTGSDPAGAPPGPRRGLAGAALRPRWGRAGIPSEPAGRIAPTAHPWSP